MAGIFFNRSYTINELDQHSRICDFLLYLLHLKFHFFHYHKFRSFGGVPGSGITEHLARHGITAEPKHVVTEDKNISEVILAQAREENADLIVMGAYEHSRLRERILGGVTYDILNLSPMPVLMNH